MRELDYLFIEGNGMTKDNEIRFCTQIESELDWSEKEMNKTKLCICAYLSSSRIGCFPKPSASLHAWEIRGLDYLFVEGNDQK